MLIFGGVFERHPKLKVVCVEADAGWVPHFKYRMDHTYERHRHVVSGNALCLLFRHVPPKLVDDVEGVRVGAVAVGEVGGPEHALVVHARQ